MLFLGSGCKPLPWDPLAPITGAPGVMVTHPTPTPQTGWGFLFAQPAFNYHSRNTQIAPMSNMAASSGYSASTPRAPTLPHGRKISS